MAKQPTNVSLGDIIEAFCERCRLNLDVSVAAITDGEIRKVQCRTCNNFVPYRPPVPESVRKDRAIKRVLAMRDRKTQRRGAPAKKGDGTVTRRGSGRQAAEPVVTRRGAGAAAAAAAAAMSAPVKPAAPSPEALARAAATKRWREMTDDVDSTRAMPYTPQRHFDEGEFLLHKSYGMGYVERIEDDEIVVLFRTGEQRLKIDQNDDE